MSTAAERIRAWRQRQRNGIATLTVRADRLWLSEALAASGYGSADDDDSTADLGNSMARPVSGSLFRSDEKIAVLKRISQRFDPPLPGAILSVPDNDQAPLSMVGRSPDRSRRPHRGFFS